MSLRGYLLNRFQRHAAGQLFLDVWPGYEPLFDGTIHRLPGKVRTLLALWRNNPTLLRESQESYDAYEGGSFFDQDFWLDVRPLLQRGHSALLRQ